jgi:hypothetical protein
MSSHQMQFQHGMSIPEFLSCFGNEERCAEVIRRSRWPGGFRCARCENAGHYMVDHGIPAKPKQNG